MPTSWRILEKGFFAIRIRFRTGQGPETEKMETVDAFLHLCHVVACIEVNFDQVDEDTREKHDMDSEKFVLVI